MDLMTSILFLLFSLIIRCVYIWLGVVDNQKRLKRIESSIMNDKLIAILPIASILIVTLISSNKYFGSKNKNVGVLKKIYYSVFVVSVIIFMVIVILK